MAYSTKDGSSWVNANGNRNVPYLNVNGDKRKLNLNWFENDWNSDHRFAAVRNFLLETPLIC